MVVFNPAPIIASMNLRRRLQREREIEEEKERRIQKEEKRKFPFKDKVLNGEQIEIYPYYVVKLVEEYKTEENGQINILETVYKTKEVIQCYKMKIGNKIKIIQENYWQNKNKMI